LGTNTKLVFIQSPTTTAEAKESLFRSFTRYIVWRNFKGSFSFCCFGDKDLKFLMQLLQDYNKLFDESIGVEVAK